MDEIISIITIIDLNNNPSNVRRIYNNIIQKVVDHSTIHRDLYYIDRIKRLENLDNRNTED